MFLTWAGVLTESALCYMFSNDDVRPDGTPKGIKTWALLLTIILSEHVFFGVRWAIKLAIGKLDSAGKQKERREKYMLRRQYFEESLSKLDKLPAMEEKGDEQITIQSLEEDQRNLSVKEATVEDKFWSRQKGWKETVSVGKIMIERAMPDTDVEDKKTQ
jgi:anoctamin-10